MSERQRPSENQDAVAAARFLMERMKAGDRIDPGTFSDLVEALKAYRAGEFTQPVRQPAAPVAVRAPAPLPPPVPARVPRQEAQRSSPEAFLEQEPWNRFNNEFARYELKFLSPEERQLIAQGAEILVQETLAFRAMQTKPIGADITSTGDYVTIDVRTPTDRSFTWEGWETYFNQAFSSERKFINAGSDNHNMVFATTAHGLAERNLAFLAVQLGTPEGTAPGECRCIPHQYVLFLKNDRMMNFLRSGKALRLIPFMIQCAAIKMNPERVVFFDGSMAGRNDLLGRAKNPVLSIVQDKNQGLIFEDRDTRTRHPAEQQFKGSNTTAFLDAIEDVRGGLYRNVEQPIRFRAWNSRLDAELRDVPRIKKGDKRGWNI